MKKKNLKKGFTLLEALVAISILMVAVVAPITIAQKGLSSAVYSKNQMIASYLAQDALEYVINKKDENALNKVNWLTGLDYCLPDASDVQQYCEIDTVSGAGVGAIGPGDGRMLKTQNGFYGFEGLNLSNAEITNFVRKVSIKPLDIGGQNDRALVTTEVKWSDDEGDRVEVKTLIFNY